MNQFSAVTTAPCARLLRRVRTIDTRARYANDMLIRRSRCNEARSPLDDVSLRAACNRATYFVRA